MKCLRLLILTGIIFQLSSCVLTKALTVPMRVAGAGISIVPVLGNVVDKAIDTSADIIDKAPI
ncbi:MAG: recombinational DNA repair protein (RecF pathway) [Chlamydiales bacterium]|jgi:recombinational DNA repair protein (RecF pathway)